MLPAAHFQVSTFEPLDGDHPPCLLVLREPHILPQSLDDLIPLFLSVVVHGVCNVLSLTAGRCQRMFDGWTRTGQKATGR